MNMVKKAKADTPKAILIKQPMRCLAMPLQRNAKARLFIRRALPVMVSQIGTNCAGGELF